MNRFYKDAVVSFTAMANNISEEPVDPAHFRMWCRIAADEINILRAALRINILRYQPETTHDQITKQMLALNLPRGVRK